MRTASNKGRIKYIIMSELTTAIEQNNTLHDELRERPFKVKASANLVDVDNHPVTTKIIQDLLNNNKRFSARINLNGTPVWCIVIGRIDSHNANFNDSEEGQIFAGVIDEDICILNVKFNDLVEFQSCDVHELK